MTDEQAISIPPDHAAAIERAVMERNQMQAQLQMAELRINNAVLTAAVALRLDTQRYATNAVRDEHGQWSFSPLPPEPLPN